MPKLEQLIEEYKEYSQAATTVTTATAQEVEESDSITPPPGKWHYISDSRVSEVVNENNILQCQAYLLFYERIY